MTEVGVREKVMQVLKNVLNLDDGVGTDQLIKKETEAWDSLKHISIVAELEIAFDIQFEPEDIVNLISGDEITRIIYEKL